MLLALIGQPARAEGAARNCAAYFRIPAFPQACPATSVTFP